MRSAIDGSVDDIAQSETWELRDHRDNPEQHYARQQRASMLSGAMMRLRPELRRVLELQQAGELSAKEIAQFLSISEPAAKSRLLRARIALRELLRNENPHMGTDGVSEARALCKSPLCRASNSSLKHQNIVRCSQAHGEEIEP
jgi:DNA-binding CsgD family transcriptional regulator